jgi:septal ring factor EnvC (AmiA/AmiB activator)
LIEEKKKWGQLQNEIDGTKWIITKLQSVLKAVRAELEVTTSENSELSSEFKAGIAKLSNTIAGIAQENSQLMETVSKQKVQIARFQNQEQFLNVLILLTLGFNC